MARKQTFTADEFAAMRKQHVPWELLMLRGAAQVLGEAEPPEDDRQGWLRRWMAIETFYIHLRSLHNFFYCEGGGRPRDAFAVDFFDDPAAWQSRRPPASEAMTHATSRAGTMVAHLSYDRQEVIDRGEGLAWFKLAEELNGVWMSFRDATARTENSVLLDDGFLVLPGEFIHIDVGYGSATTVSTPGPVGAYLSSLFSGDKRRK